MKKAADEAARLALLQVDPEASKTLRHRCGIDGLVADTTAGSDDKSSPQQHRSEAVARVDAGRRHCLETDRSRLMMQGGLLHMKVQYIRAGPLANQLVIACVHLIRLILFELGSVNGEA